MGIKSTQQLSRTEAEARYVELRLQDGNMMRQLRAEAVLMDDTTLENKLEELDDKVCGGESFRNYSIVFKDET